jgi:hypothetical protein
MDQPTLYVTFAGPGGSQPFGPYAGVMIQPDDYNLDVLLLLVHRTGQSPTDQAGDGHCLAAREEGVWRLSAGLHAEEDGPGYTKVSIGTGRL